MFMALKELIKYGIRYGIDRWLNISLFLIQPSVSFIPPYLTEYTQILPPSSPSLLQLIKTTSSIPLCQTSFEINI